MSLESLKTALADRYRLERELGAGGMATVYLAHDLRHGRSVAIKVLRPELAAVIGAERFVREIRTIAALQHPHILGLIDSGEIDGTAWCVMPFVEGESLFPLGNLTASFDVAPDGRFIMFRPLPESATAMRLLLLDNWLERKP